DLQFGREVSANDLNLKCPVSDWIKGRICLESSDGGGVRINVAKQPALDCFGFAGLIESSRFGFFLLGMASRYVINRLIDSRNCYQLIQRDLVISKNNNDSSRSSKSNSNDTKRYDRINTVELVLSRVKSGIIFSTHLGLNASRRSLFSDREYAN